MKKHSGTILLVLIFFVGLAVMLYPTISDYINQRNQTRVVNSYAQQVDGLSDADYTAYFDAADVFNQKMRSMRRSPPTRMPCTTPTAFPPTAPRWT